MEVLTGKLVVLQPLHERYFDCYLRMFSPVVRQCLRVQSLSSEYTYLYNALERQRQGKTFFYCIFSRLTDQLIGAIEIRDRDLYHGQLYCWVNEHFWGTGCFEQALSLVADAYFTSHAVLFLNAHVDMGNRRSHQALKKCGFAEAGIFNGPNGKQYQLVLRKR